MSDMPNEVREAAREIARASLNTLRNIIAEEFPGVEPEIQSEFVAEVCAMMSGKADDDGRGQVLAIDKYVKADQLTAAQQRVAELERSIEGLAQFNAKLLDEQRDKNERLTAENARLREAIQSVLGYVALPKRYREELEAANRE